MFLLTFLYFALNILKMYQNAFYEVIPPPYEVIPMMENTTNAFYEVNPPYEVTPPYEVNLSDEYVQEVRMQAAIERFASFDEYMDIPLSLPEDDGDDDVDDEETVYYDDEQYRFNKCGEIEGCYDYSEFYESETVVPEHDDYFLDENETHVPMNMDNADNRYDYNDYEDDYYNDLNYWQDMRIEALIDRFENLRID